MDDKKIEIVRFIRKYTPKQNEMRFCYLMAVVLKNFLINGKFSCNGPQYRMLAFVRKRLKIPGRTYDLVDLELKDKFIHMSDWVFKKQTNKQMIEFYDHYIDNIKILVN